MIDSQQLDRSFISVIERALPTVRLVIAMAERFDMNVVAEGVETAEQLQLMQQCQCNEY